MTTITDGDFAVYKKTIRELIGRAGSSDIAKEVAKDFSLLFLDFMEHDDRAAGLLVGVTLEEATRDLLGGYLVDDRNSRKLLQRNEALGSHSARIHLAYGLGLLPVWLRDDLLVHREIRNECAHERARFFSKRPLSTLIDRLQVGHAIDRMIETGKLPSTAIEGRQAKFFVSAALVWIRLRVWGRVLADDFRCTPLPELKRSVFRKSRTG